MKRGNPGSDAPNVALVLWNVAPEAAQPSTLSTCCTCRAAAKCSVAAAFASMVHVPVPLKLTRPGGMIEHPAVLAAPSMLKTTAASGSVSLVDASTLKD